MKVGLLLSFIVLGHVAGAASAPASVPQVVCPSTEPSTSADPVAVPDLAFLTGAEVVISVLANDIVGAGGRLEIIGVSAASHGTVSYTATTVTYRALGPMQTDQFTYTIRDATRPSAPTSAAVVEVRSQASVAIAAECRGGGSCLFEAFPTPADGVVRYEWKFAGSGAWKTAGRREFHLFTAVGTYPVTVRVTYLSGAVAEKTIQQQISFRQELRWACRFVGEGYGAGAPIYDDGEMCDEAYVHIDPGSLVTFPRGQWGYDFTVKWANSPADVALGHYISVPSCASSCTTGAAYLRSGVYQIDVRLHAKGASLADPATIEHTFSRYINITNFAPVAAFTAQQYYDTREWIFDPAGTTDVDELTRLYGPPRLYEWDFGDGESVVLTRQPEGPVPVARHNYVRPGDHRVTLKVTDMEGLSGTKTQTISVVNAAPRATLIRPNCAGLACWLDASGWDDLHFEGGERGWEWEWDLADGTTIPFGRDATSIQHEFPEAGCYDVRASVRDLDGATAAKTATIAVSTARLSPIGGVTVDAHTGDYMVPRNGDPAQGGSVYYTRSNLNGIAEPGERLLVEPTWAASSQSQPYQVGAVLTVPGGMTATSGTFATYHFETGVADCGRTSGRTCHGLDIAAADNRTATHSDITIAEAHPSGGMVTTKVHVGASFTDVPVNAWYYASAEALLHAGVTGGCAARRFCPANILTRGELATFLVRAKKGSGYTPPQCVEPNRPYPDVPCANTFAPFIAVAKAEGIMRAAADGTFGPGVAVRRVDMAEPLLRASTSLTTAPPCDNFGFSDVSCHDGSMPGGWISELKRRGITNGCADGLYCPLRDVDRASMAVFLERAFKLAIDHKVCATGRTIHPLSIF